MTPTCAWCGGALNRIEVGASRAAGIPPQCYGCFERLVDAMDAIDARVRAEGRLRAAAVLPTRGGRRD